MTQDRRQAARAFRYEAADTAFNRDHPVHKANPDEQRYASACYPMSFTKGLKHDVTTGLVEDPADFEAFRAAIDAGFIEPFTTRVPVPRAPERHRRRQWEAPTAGVVFDLEGPDAQAVTMPPAPPLCSDELAFEMAEVYELALLRDVKFTDFEGAGAGPAGSALQGSIDRMNGLAYAKGDNPFSGRPRKTANGSLDRQTAFRGSSPGVEKGPYLSQFMIIGNGDPAEGLVGYGANRIDQRVPQAVEKDDYMVVWDHWLDVQDGLEVRAEPNPCDPRGFGQKFEPHGNDGPSGAALRFITTPRDLATYVHVDALYQAYLNACLILLGNNTPFDPAFDVLSGANNHQLLVNTAETQKVDMNAGGFALYGGPHILSLVTEVATRGLKAVRYQKFNVHLRLRPETLAGRLEKAGLIDQKYPSTCCCFGQMRHALADTIAAIAVHNQSIDAAASEALLPMAFAEGSPMHPTYGAGHATVAGACVTVLKAFFDTSAIFARTTEADEGGDPIIRAGFYGKSQIDCFKSRGLQVDYGAYKVEDDGMCLEFETFDPTCSYTKDGSLSKKHSCPLTLEGELNKLAANISIGRNMAGVHYFSDYYDSIRMGEKIAIGMLEEQALAYPTDRFVMTIPTFDGEVITVGRR